MVVPGIARIPLPETRISFVDEDDAGVVAAGISKEVLDLSLGHAHELRLDVSVRDGYHPHARFLGECSNKHGFACLGRAVERDARGRLARQDIESKGFGIAEREGEEPKSPDWCQSYCRSAQMWWRSCLVPVSYFSPPDFIWGASYQSGLHIPRTPHPLCLTPLTVAQIRMGRQMEVEVE